SLVPKEYFLKSPLEMSERFARFPGAVANTVKVAEKCNLEFQFKDEKGRAIYHLPKYVPDGHKPGDQFDLIAYFREKSRDGLRERLKGPALQGKDPSPYTQRLEDELSMIER